MNLADFEIVFDHIFYQLLRFNPEEFKAVMITEPANMPVDKREQLTQIMMEKYMVRNFFFASGPFCAGD